MLSNKNAIDDVCDYVRRGEWKAFSFLKTVSMRMLLLYQAAFSGYKLNYIKKSPIDRFD